MRAIIPVLCALFGLSACSGSTSGPFGWFSGGGPEATSDAQAIAEGRALPVVAGLAEAETAPTRQGVIVRATGIAPTQGYYNARLVPASAEPPEGSVLTLVFLADPPAAALPVGTQASRRVMAALFLHDNDLPQVRTIRIQTAAGARNLAR